MDVGHRRRLQGASAWRHRLALTLLLAVVGAVGERPRGDGAGAVANATVSRPSRMSAEQAIHCQLAGGAVDPAAIVDVLMAAPMCAAVRISIAERATPGRTARRTPPATASEGAS
jgi:hypothetical protein